MPVGLLHFEQVHLAHLNNNIVNVDSGYFKEVLFYVGSRVVQLNHLYSALDLVFLVVLGS
jgi:hypothetical protein